MGKIACTIIIKDDTEAKQLDRCLSTVAPFVDKIFITGTKKPQVKVKKVCKKYNADWSWFAWIKDFSAARNFNIAQAKDYEWFFWIDSDDILVGGANLKPVVELAEKNNISAVFARYLYQVEVDSEGNVKNILIEHLRERLIKNDGNYRWIAPIHETLIEQKPSNKTDNQSFYVIHLTDWKRMEEAMWRNIGILEQEVIDKFNDPRPIYYLAKAYFDTKEPMVLYEPAGDGVDSITVELLKDYLKKSGWQEERAQAWEYLSMIHRERGEYQKALQCLFEALIETPMFPSVYIQLAITYVNLQEWDRALHWIKLAGEVEIPKTTLVINPKDYKLMMLEALYHIYMNTGKLDETLKVAKGLVDLQPSEDNKKKFEAIIDLRHKNDMAHWVVNLASHLKKTQQVSELAALSHSIPKEIAMEPVMINLKSEITPPRTWEDNEIALWCGPGWEKWTPKNASKGIGGSEEAVIYLMQELTKLGWKVTVFGEPQEDEGDYEGVKYVPHYSINWQDKFNIFISWRQPHVFDVPFRSNKNFLWLHDIQNALDYTPERISKIDKVMFLSKWHRNNVPSLPEDKIMYTANGLNI
jgi:tetratricopeptide (TPR) repeat protein